MRWMGIVAGLLLGWVMACGSDDEGGGTAGGAGSGGSGAKPDGAVGGAGVAGAGGTWTTGGSGGGGGSGGSGGSTDGGCAPGTKTCTGGVAHDCGSPSSSGTDCSSEGKQCFEGLGCAVCKPGPVSCTQTLAKHCKKDGSAIMEVACDPDMGLSCQGDACVGSPCSPAAVEDSYIGCEYYPTTVLNNVNNSYDFEIAVANGSATADAHVKVTGGALSAPVTATVAPGQVARIPLPWQTQVKVCYATSLGNAFDQVNACSAANAPDYSSRVVAGGAYRMLSDQPVAVYQFAPIQSTKGTAQAGTTEASLLIPQSSMGASYRVATYGQGFARGAVTIVATVDGTKIDATPKVDVTAAPGYPTGIKAGTTATFTANRGDVVELIATTAGSTTNEGDLTGTNVKADHPVEVFGVHGCAWVIDAKSCDHLEDTMYPDGTLGTEYVAKSVPYTGSSAYLLRVLALEDASSVSFDPPAVSPPKTLAKGEVYDISATDIAVHVKSDKRVLLAGLNEGDNTLSLVVPIARFRKDYLFLAPEFQHNYAKLVAPTGATVTLDGAPVPSSSFTAVGSSGWSWAIVSITKGAHRAQSDKAFGVAVFGNQEAGFTPGGLPSAYEYAAGLDLHAAPSITAPK